MGTNDIQSLILQIDDIEGNEDDGDSDIREELDGLTDDLVDYIIEAQEAVLEAKEDVEDVHEDANANIDQNIGGIAFWTFIPGLSIIFAGALAICLDKRQPIGCIMVQFFCCHGIYCVLAGFFFFLSVLNSDFCDNHELIVYNVFGDADMDFINPTETRSAGEIFLDVLNCPDDNDGTDPTTPDNNLIDLLNLRNMLNVSSEINEIDTLLDDGIDEIEASLDAISDATISLDDVSNATAVDVGSDFNGTDYIAQLNAVKRNRLAPHPFSRNDEDHQDALVEAYGGDADLADNTWGAYGALINVTNQILQSMVEVPEPWATVYPFDFKTILNFTVNVVSSTTGAFYIASNDVDLIANTSGSDGSSYAQYQSYNQYVALNTSVVAVQQTSKLFEDVIQANADANKKIDKIILLIEEIDEDLEDLHNSQDSIIDWISDVDDSFDDVIAEVISVIESLEGVKDQVFSIQDFVLQAGDYLHCALIGNFYRNFFLNTWCDDMTDNAYSIGEATLVVAVTMFLVHFFIAIYWPTFWGISRHQNQRTQQVAPQPNFYSEAASQRKCGGCCPKLK
mmetsp:Transcript_16392/g.21297  ORF Transcript_16392/g.21297 Transcript_16392/m.21297 type:complete len:566 (+) Transcript_16392:1-1698(+)